MSNARLHSTEIENLTDFQLNCFVPACFGYEVTGRLKESFETPSVFVTTAKGLVQLNAMEYSQSLSIAALHLANISVINQDQIYCGQNLQVQLKAGVCFLVGENLVSDPSLIRCIYKCLIRTCCNGAKSVQWYNDDLKSVMIPKLSTTVGKNSVPVH